MSGRVWPMKLGSAAVAQSPPSPDPSNRCSWFSMGLDGYPTPCFSWTHWSFFQVWPPIRGSAPEPVLLYAASHYCSCYLWGYLSFPEDTKAEFQ